MNPNAPLYIPAVFRQVEDFSPEWWQLITTSTWFHDYWVSQHQGEDGFYDDAEIADHNDVSELLPETIDDFGPADDFSGLEAQFEEFVQMSEAENDKSAP